MADANFAVAIFPFLKTSAPIDIGGYVFQSTDNLTGLPPNQARAVSEIAQLLFVRDDLRVKSASFTILPALEIHSGDQRLIRLSHLRDTVAYFYSAPHETMEHVFLGPEETSLALLSPARVSVFLTRPGHHTEKVGPEIGEIPDSFHNVRGYNGLYNFRHEFWIEPGGRLYGPKPHITLNISQNMYHDFGSQMRGRPDYELLMNLLRRPDTPVSQRVFSSLRWFNAANEHGNDQSRALLNLAVAFETLLRLPESAKTDRLVDAISLLLGRTERLNEWATQFYAARSSVVHEGAVRDAYFYATGAKEKRIFDIFGSLILYGRQIFQLCVGAVIFGADLADRSDLQEKFITNNERFSKICSALGSGDREPGAKLLDLVPIIQSLQRYRFVAQRVEPGPMVAAVRLACAALIESRQSLSEALSVAVSGCARLGREEPEIKRLSAIEALYLVFEKTELAGLATEIRVVRDLVELVWMSLFQRFYWLKERVES